MTINDECPLDSGSQAAQDFSGGSAQEDQHRLRSTIEGLSALARVAINKGDTQGAFQCFDMLLQIDPDSPSVLVDKGALLYRLGKIEDALAVLETAHKIAPDDELVLINLAIALAESGRRNEAVVAFRRVLQLHPQNLYAKHQLRRLTSVIVPFWHVRMLNDKKRNEAFEAAIRIAIERFGTSARVLDIGSGTGLLSMMAARAGATNVVTCERVPAIAELAKQIVVLNRFDDRVRVVGKDSSQLELGKDIDGPVDVLISEIISSDLLAENVLDTFQDAHSRLLRKNATVIPRAATAVGCLIESAVLSKYTSVGDVSGFDVSPFAELSPLRLPVHGTMTSWRRLSHDFDLVRIDLALAKHEPELRKVIVPVLDNGQAIGVVQWMRLDLADGIEFSNHPDTYFDGGWLQVLHTFAHPVAVSKGELLELMIGHDRVSLIVTPLERQPAAKKALEAEPFE